MVGKCLGYIFQVVFISVLVFLELVSYILLFDYMKVMKRKSDVKFIYKIVQENRYLF